MSSDIYPKYQLPSGNWTTDQEHADRLWARQYPSPEHISYDENSRWCQDHGHTGLLTGSVCGLCDHLIETDPRFTDVIRWL